MALELTPLGGRYPFGTVRYDPQTIRARLECIGDRVLIRVDDDRNPDVWCEFAIDVQALLAELTARQGR